MRLFALALLASLSVPIAVTQAGTVSGTLSIAVSPPALALIINPSSATLACNAAAGTVVAALSVTGGDGNAIAYSLAGNTTDFAISGSNVVVGPSGIASGSCGKTFAETITATQP